LQHNSLDVFRMRLHDFSMPPPPISEDNALFVIKLTFGDDRAIKVEVKKGKKRIDALMSAQAKQATGIGSLSEQQLANLDSFLDPDKVVAPGHTD
jgi:hypothetical protein